MKIFLNAPREVAEAWAGRAAELRAATDAELSGRAWSASPGAGKRGGKIGKIIISKFLQIFGGLVLGCIKTKFCKKICV